MLREDWQRAARLYATAEAQITQIGMQRDAGDDAFIAPLIAKARAALDEAAFSDAESSGRALSYEQAMREARAWLTG